MDEQNKTKLSEFLSEQQDVDATSLTDEQKKQLQDYLNDQATRLGEVFSQCWESDEFKQAFMEDPKAIFDEYGVNYKKNSNYKIIDTPDKTMIHILPYKGVKKGMKQFSDMLMNHVKDLEDDEEKQVLLEGWSWQVYQNTEDTYYLPIPLCPENLSPEELELVNGGCLVFAILLLFEAAAAITSTSVAAELMLLAVGYAAAVADTVAVVVVGALLALMVVEFEVSVQTVVTEFTVASNTGEVVFTFVNGSKGAEFPNAFKSAGPNGTVDPRRRGR